MHTSKHSLNMLDGHEDLQGKVTNDAFLFAQVMMKEAKANSLTREQFIKEATSNPTRRRKNHRTGAR